MFERGTQIIYIPDHIEKITKNNFYYPNGIQPGFVTSVTADGSCFCRYWAYDEKQQAYIGCLRTLSGSELTMARNLREYHYMSSWLVERELAKL